MCQCFFDCSGWAASLAVSNLIIHAMLRPSVRMVCMPSSTKLYSKMKLRFLSTLLHPYKVQCIPLDDKRIAFWML